MSSPLNDSARFPPANAGLITIRGAAQNNLQDLDVDLPQDKLIAISGVSGSGKTSLAFDTIYAEARRRYLMTVDRNGKGLVRHLRVPRIRQVEGLFPAVAIGQGRGRQNPRSTVATLAGIYDYLRLLFARLGTPHCLLCEGVVQQQRFEEVLETAAGLVDGTKLLVLAPRGVGEDGEGRSFLEWIDRAGYRRVRVDGKMLLVEDIQDAINPQARLEVVVDRLVIKADTRRRLKGSLQAALELGEGRVVLAALDGRSDMAFSVRPSCAACGSPFPPLKPVLFSFNSSRGACPDCRGLGTQSGLYFEQVFDRGRATLEEALGSLWQELGFGELRQKIYRFCKKYSVDPDVPVGEWPEETISRFWSGSGKRGSFIGVNRWLERLRARAEGGVGTWLDERLGDKPCPACNGTRLAPAALAVEIEGHNIRALTALSIAELASLLPGLSLAGPRAAMGDAIRGHVQGKLETLKNLGLGYLSLDRRSDSLASGEFQRLRLASVLGSGMTQVLYVLDEPSIGLHARDVSRLLQALLELRDAGNTVVVVEHDQCLIKNADYVLDLGPGAGIHGGRIVAQGSPGEVEGTDSLTGRYLSGRLILGRGVYRRPGLGGWLLLEGLNGHNLKNISASFPLGNLICVTGVSGSGKSSLVSETLYPLLAAHLQGGEQPPLNYSSCRGLEHLERIVGVDQKPIGRTPRSNAATYTGLLAPIRQLYAELPEARLRAYKPGHFSFNAQEGACPECDGRGCSTVEQRVFEDLEVICGACSGKRYKGEILDILYRGKDISEVLEMSVDQALEFFAAIPDIARRLSTLAAVGLGYLLLGQPASSLSGGEAQRVKLAAELGRPQSSRTLYVLDEPTTGLHLEDVRFLFKLLQQLVERGNTVVVVEHHIELIALCDYVIDLGPEGGEGGGWIVAQGDPREVAQVAESWTGRFLHQHFKERER